jgi:hypothetical protein
MLMVAGRHGNSGIPVYLHAVVVCKLEDESAKVLSVKVMAYHVKEEPVRHEHVINSHAKVKLDVVTVFSTKKIRTSN